MNFGDKLRELRLSKKLSQQRLAEITGLSQSAIALWENGDRVPAFDAVQALCLALGVSCAAFDGCEYTPVTKKRTRGRPKKP